ncbi:hypothetical protein chiPu_0007760, partial [Chiloscyllium punctatum]|nr:hypothetical protein [Chiloscyllium punctatum]
LPTFPLPPKKWRRQERAHAHCHFPFAEYCGDAENPKMADLANEEKPAIAPPVFVFQKNEKGQKEKLEPMTSTTPPSNKRPVDASSPEDAEDSDRDDGNYPPPVKRERSSSFTQVFPPAQPVPKNNVFMPLSFCQTAASNSDSEPDEKNVGFRLKPPTLIHGQAPSAGLPSQKSKEQQRSVLRPAVLQPPQQKSFTQNVASSGTNGVSKQTEEGITAPSVTLNNTSDEETTPINSSAATPSYMENTKLAESSESKSSCEVDEKEEKLDSQEQPEQLMEQTNFVFGENLQDRVKMMEGSDFTCPLKQSSADGETLPATNYFLQYIKQNTAKTQDSRNHPEIQCKLFVFDKTSQSWVERGRGLLRLNDMASADDGALQSRLVMRTQGSLRLILNTKLWAQMQIDKASEKSIRITAMDAEDQGVKVFLISASSKDAGQLYAALHHRILALRSRCEQEPEPPCIVSEAGVTQSNEEDSDDDDEVIVPATATSGPCDTDDKQTTGST